MQTREQVIRGLECCVLNDPDDKRECANCPRTEGGKIISLGCVNGLMAAALALLKEQQRVMVRSEIRNASRIPVWLDVKSKHKDLYRGWVLAYEVQKGMGITGERLGMTDPSGRIHWLKLDDYGVTWRVWTDEPTDEQREAVAWE